jgi:hypothetical protein
MQTLSFKNTRLFKRGIWLSAAALIAFVAAPSALDASLWLNPVPSAIAIGLLCAALLIFFWKTQVHRLADAVVATEDALKVSRGRLDDTIPLSNVSGAEVLSGGGFHRITIRLRERSKLGRQIDFLPQASLWSNLPAIKSVALNLSERAGQARRASGTSSS